MTLTREPILNALENALQPLPYVQSMYQGGAAAFNRADQWSDIDLMVIVDDDHIPDTVAVFEKVLRDLSPVELRYELPQPTWHGHWQAFYILRDAGPFLMIDLCILKASNTNRFLEKEIHGDAVIHFDKTGLVKSPPLNAEAHFKQIKTRLETVRVTFELFQSLTQKELNRGNRIEAFTFYQAYTVRPLIEVLRMQYDPARYNFHTRYIYHYFPREVVQRLEPLFFVVDAQQLQTRLEEAQQFFHEAIDQVDLNAVAEKLGLVVN